MRQTLPKELSDAGHNVNRISSSPQAINWPISVIKLGLWWESDAYHAGSLSLGAFPSTVKQFWDWKSVAQQTLPNQMYIMLIHCNPQMFSSSENWGRKKKGGKNEQREERNFFNTVDVYFWVLSSQNYKLSVIISLVCVWPQMYKKEDV